MGARTHHIKMLPALTLPAAPQPLFARGHTLPLAQLPRPALDPTFCLASASPPGCLLSGVPQDCGSQALQPGGLAPSRLPEPPFQQEQPLCGRINAADLDSNPAAANFLRFFP